MFSFYVKSPVSGLSKQHLHEYQAGEAVGYTVDCKDGRFYVNKWCLHNSDFLLTMHKGKLKTDQTWTGNIHRWYPFSQHLNSLKKCCEKGYHRCMFRCTFQLGTSKDGNNFESFEARKNFKGKGRKTFDLKEFRRTPIRIVYDSLHGISTVGIHEHLAQKYLQSSPKD